MAIALIGLACGEGGPSPGSPVAPPVPDADIVAAGGLTFGSCTGPGCRYSIDYRNDGSGCANNLRGKVRIYDGDVLLETDDWFVDPSVVMTPGAPIRVEDCCFSPSAVGRQSRFTSEQFWNNIPCD